MHSSDAHRLDGATSSQCGADPIVDARRSIADVILITAHGDGGADGRDAVVQALAESLSRRMDVPVEWAVLKRPETFAEARARLGGAAKSVVIYPFFMTDGYFVRVKLPKILTDSGFATFHTLTPFGHDPGLTDLIEARLDAAVASARGEQPIALIAHGSRSGEPASRRAAEGVAAALRQRGFAKLHLGFIEEAPLYSTVIAEAQPAIVLGYFASEGTHALDDVKSVVDDTPSVRHHITAIGADAGVVDIVARAVFDCISR